MDRVRSRSLSLNLLLLVAAAVMAALTACSNDSNSGESRAPTTRDWTTATESGVSTTSVSVPRSTSTSTAMAGDPVLTSYLAFWDMYVELGATPPPFDTVAVTARLEQLTTGAETTQLLAFLQNNATTGLVLRGESDHAPTVLSNDGQLAVVEDCVDDRVGVYRVADDSRVDTDDPARRLYTTTLRQIDGIWKVERVHTEGETCTA